jgi:hypothetical protein
MDPGQAYSLICDGDHDSSTMASFVEKMMAQDDDAGGACAAASAAAGLAEQQYHNSM